TAPVERWDTNIMEEEGHTKFRAMLEDIKQMIRDLWCVLVYSDSQSLPHALLEIL
ncbi:hypothetical protein M378DRAFT_161560, partial [Amanita muscaria Koide BX008]